MSTARGRNNERTRQKKRRGKQRHFVSSTEMRGQQNRPEETVNPHLGYEPAVTLKSLSLT